MSYWAELTAKQLGFLEEMEIEMPAAAAVRDFGWYQVEVGKSE